MHNSNISRQLLHDLLTPLNHIIGYTELLLDGSHEENQKTVVGDIGKIRAAAGRLLEIINDNFGAVSSSPSPNSLDVAILPDEGILNVPVFEELIVGSSQGIVLVVDDDSNNRDVLERHLKRQGYGVATAENGRQALEMMSASSFDLLLLDILMPEVDGFEVLKRLKSDVRLQHIPVIMISALNDMDLAIRCIELGAEDYLPKPFDPILLRARTVACLERKHAYEHRRRVTVLDERNRIAREIHDTLAQSFAGILLHSRLARRIVETQPVEAWCIIEQVSEIAQQGLIQARRSVWDLHPEANEYRDLTRKLTQYIERLSSGATAVIEMRIHGSQRDVTPCIGMELVRIGQEALSNALRHAQPCNVTCDLTFEPDQVVMSITDDGKGFDLKHQVDSIGYGLTSMSQRAERLGGRFTISSQPGQGTEVSVWVPFVPAHQGVK